MNDQVPYNTGRVLIGSKAPLPVYVEDMGRDAERLQKALIGVENSDHRWVVRLSVLILIGLFIAWVW